MRVVRVAALLACHNRRAKTLACLDALFASAAEAARVELHAFLTDDASTDGTSEAVREKGWPVTIVHGNGGLFWTGGMVLAWEAASAVAPAFDAFLLLNDDTVLDPSAVPTLVELALREGDRTIVVAATRDPDSGELTYGGVVRSVPWHPAKMERLSESEHLQEADTFNGNCVLVPRAVYDAIGPLDARYRHGMSDYDYGLRARRAGFRVMVAPGTLGTCSRNPVTGTWEDASLPLERRLRLLNSPKGLPMRGWSLYLRRHGPWFWMLLSVGPAVRVLATWLSQRVAGFRRA